MGNGMRRLFGEATSQSTHSLFYRLRSSTFGDSIRKAIFMNQLPKWKGIYIQSYLEQDIQTIGQFGNLTQYLESLQSLAAQSCQLLHVSDVSKDNAIDVGSLRLRVAVRESTYQVIVSTHIT